MRDEHEARGDGVHQRVEAGCDGAHCEGGCLVVVMVLSLSCSRLMRGWRCDLLIVLCRAKKRGNGGKEKESR
jgi:hypothetical protein